MLIRELKFITNKINNANKWLPRLAYTTPELKQEEIMKNLIEREKILRKKLDVYLKDDSASRTFKSAKDDNLLDDVRIIKPLGERLRLGEETTVIRDPAIHRELTTLNRDLTLKWDDFKDVNCGDGSFAGNNTYFDEQDKCNTYIWLFDAAKWYRFDEYDCYFLVHELRYLFPINAVDVNLTYYFRFVGHTSLYMGAETGIFKLWALPIEAPDFYEIVDPEDFSIEYFDSCENDENIVCRGTENTNWLYGEKEFSGSFRVEKGVQSGLVVIVPIIICALDGYVLAYNGSFFIDNETYPYNLLYKNGITIYLEEL